MARSYLLASWLFLAGLMIGGAMGCSSRGEVRLWPVVDVERPDPEGGPHIEVLWPIVEVDKTEPETAYAIRPLWSYDARTEQGSFLWPFGGFGWLPQPHYQFWPLHFWKQWDEESQTGEHLVAPFGGYWHTPQTKHWLWGPGLYYRERSQENPDEKLDITLIPPLIYDRDAESSFFLLANYYQHRAPHRFSRVFFPFVWWQNLGDPDLPTPEARFARSRALFPLVGWTRVESQAGVRSSQLRFLWPLLSLQWGPEAGWNQALLYLISWRVQDEELTHLNLLPFFSDSPTHFSIPLLGFCRWDSTAQVVSADASKGSVRKGWASWPFVTHQTTYERAQPNEIIEDRWTYLAGLVGTRERPRRLKSHYFWPFYEVKSHYRDAPVDELGASTEASSTDGVQLSRRTRQYLAGLVRSDVRPLEGYRRVDPLYPLISHETSPDSRAHRFWPLYRYSADRESTRFHALAELLSVQHETRVSEGPEVFLRPFTYQSTPDGDYRFRLFWKLFESRRHGEEDSWGLHPLIYRRHNPDDSALLFLGGLIGHVRNGENHGLRLFWFFDL